MRAVRLVMLFQSRISIGSSCQQKTVEKGVKYIDDGEE